MCLHFRTFPDNCQYHQVIRMGETLISAKYPPHIDVSRAPLAYGHRALPRMVSYLINVLIPRELARDLRHICCSVSPVVIPSYDILDLFVRVQTGGFY